MTKMDTLTLIAFLSLFQVGACFFGGGGMSGLSYLPRFMQACGPTYTNSFQPCSPPPPRTAFDPFGWSRQAQRRPASPPRPPPYPYPAQYPGYPSGYPGYPAQPGQVPRRVRRAVPPQQPYGQQQTTQQRQPAYRNPPRYYYAAPPGPPPPPPPTPQTRYPASACRDAAMMSMLMNSDGPPMFSPAARRFQRLAKCLPVPQQVNAVLKQWNMGDFPGVCCVPKLAATP